MPLPSATNMEVASSSRSASPVASSISSLGSDEKMQSLKNPSPFGRDQSVFQINPAIVGEGNPLSWPEQDKSGEKIENPFRLIPMSAPSDGASPAAEAEPAAESGVTTAGLRLDFGASSSSSTAEPSGWCSSSSPTVGSWTGEGTSSASSSRNPFAQKRDPGENSGLCGMFAQSTSSSSTTRPPPQSSPTSASEVEVVAASAAEAVVDVSRGAATGFSSAISCTSASTAGAVASSVDSSCAAPKKSIAVDKISISSRTSYSGAMFSSSAPPPPPLVPSNTSSLNFTFGGSSGSGAPAAAHNTSSAAVPAPVAVIAAPHGQLLQSGNAANGMEVEGATSMKVNDVDHDHVVDDEEAAIMVGTPTASKNVKLASPSPVRMDGVVSGGTDFTPPRNSCLTPQNKSTRRNLKSQLAHRPREICLKEQRFNITSFEERLQPPRWCEPPAARATLTMELLDSTGTSVEPARPSHHLNRRHQIIGSDPNTCDVVISGLAKEHCALVYHRSGQPYICFFESGELAPNEELAEDSFSAQQEDMLQDYDKYEELRGLPQKIRLGDIWFMLRGNLTCVRQVVGKRRSRGAGAEADDDERDEHDDGPPSIRDRSDKWRKRARRDSDESGEVGESPVAAAARCSRVSGLRGREVAFEEDMEKEVADREGLCDGSSAGASRPQSSSGGVPAYGPLSPRQSVHSSFRTGKRRSSAVSFAPDALGPDSD